MMFKRYSNQPARPDNRLNSSSFSNSFAYEQRKGFFTNSYLDESNAIILFLSKRGTLRAPFACETLRKIIVDTQYKGRLGLFSRGVTMVYDQCPVDRRINNYSSLTGTIIEGQSKFAQPEDLEKSDFIISLDQESMDFAKLHRKRGYLYPFTFFRPSGINGFIADPYEENNDLDLHYREIISSIEFGCKRIVLSLLSTLNF